MEKREVVISVKDLVKEYPHLIAVDHISFEVYRGEIFGLLGQNGAGKTTTLEMIEGLRKMSSGNINVLNHDVRTQMTDIKCRIGVQLQSSAYFRNLSLKEILELFAGFYGMKADVKGLLEMVGLSEKINEKVENLSGGQKQRFSIISSLVNDPEIVFLDEPTTGLDPLARRNLWKLIAEIKKRGKTVILTTHYMEEAEILCDRIAIMDKGKILAMNETHKLIEQADYPFVINFVVKNIDPKVLKEIIGHGKESENDYARGGHYEIKFDNQKSLNKALHLVQDLDPESVTVGRATLEDVFIDFTGKTIEE